MMLLCGPDWMVAVSSEGGSSVFPRQLCAMSSVQCPAAGRWRPAPHSVAYPPIVRAWGPVTRQRQCTTTTPAPCLGWDGLAAHYIIHGTSLSDPGVVLILVQSCVGRLGVFTNTVLLPSITVCTLPNCGVCPLQWCHTVQRRNGADVRPLGGITTPPIIRLALTGSI